MACRFSKLETRFGQHVLPLIDPHGLRISLTESGDSLGRQFTPWERSPIPVGTHQIRGWRARGWSNVTWVDHFVSDRCPRFSKNWRGKRLAALQRRRLASGGTCSCTSWTCGSMSLRTLRRSLRSMLTAPRGAWGTGSVHHLAWRMDDEAASTRSAATSRGRWRAADAGD